jgi:hypothetical protein
MRGPDLLLAHLALLPEPDEDVEAADERPSARERLAEALGPEVAAEAVAAASAGTSRGSP